MENDINLRNATIIAENPEASFLIEGQMLHAVDHEVAALKKEKSKPEHVLPIMREALRALVKFGKGKVEAHFTNIDFNALSKKSNERLEIISSIENIYRHLHTHDRNHLSSLIHHKQTV